MSDNFHKKTRTFVTIVLQVSAERVLSDFEAAEFGDMVSLFIMPSSLGKIFSTNLLRYFSYFFQKTDNGDNLHEMSNSVFLEK